MTSSALADGAIWPAAVRSALLGTDRAPLTLPAIDGALGAACATLTRDERDAPGALLRVAAAVSAYRRCGVIPSRSAQPLPEPSTPDRRATCPLAAGAMLRRILQGEHEGLLATWLRLADRGSVRAPADTLDTLLDLARRDSSLRPLVRAAGGERARWLAGLNEDWAFAVAGDSPEALVATWETGTGAARVAALRQLRLIDAERARTMLESSWAQETAADRGELIAALGDGLSIADEPFLERALDDRRKEVRQGAAALLAQLPTSQLVARMVARARELVTLGRSGLLKRLRIDVTLPTEPDAALVRDGVDAKGRFGIGERAWWLAQILAVVPPSTWTSALSVEPDALLRALDGHEWREPLMAGWVTATERHRDASWAVAFWQNESVARLESNWSAPAPEAVFTAICPAEQVDATLRTSIGAAHDALRGSHPVLAALLQWQHEWSDALAHAVALRLKQYAGVDRIPLTGEFGIRLLLDQCAGAVPVSAVAAFTDGWSEQSDVWPTWAPAIDKLTSVLRFRNDLHLAFTEESSS